MPVKRALQECTSSNLGHPDWVSQFGERLLPNKLIVVLLQMQPGRYGNPEREMTQRLVSRQQELLCWAASKQIPVVFGQRKGYGGTISELLDSVGSFWASPEFGGKSLFRETPRFVEPVRPQAMEDSHFSGRTTLILGGVNSTGGVLETIIDAWKLGFNVLLPEDAHGEVYQKGNGEDRDFFAERVLRPGARNDTAEPLLTTSKQMRILLSGNSRMRLFLKEKITFFDGQCSYLRDTKGERIPRIFSGTQQMIKMADGLNNRSNISRGVAV